MIDYENYQEYRLSLEPSESEWVGGDDGENTHDQNPFGANKQPKLRVQSWLFFWRGLEKGYQYGEARSIILLWA